MIYGKLGLIAFLGLFIFTVTVSAQQLKPTEIIYSRLPNDLNAPPRGLNQPTIWAVGQDGSNDRFITFGTMPRISDDGRFLFYKSFTQTAIFFNPLGKYADFIVRDLATGQETIIIASSFDIENSGYSFSPESNQGNFEIIYDLSCFVYKRNRDGSNNTLLPDGPGGPDTFCRDFPAVRRGDQLIAYSNKVFTGTDGGLYTLGINGTNRQKIPNTTCRDFYPAWSNDNQFIAFGNQYFACNSNNFPNLSTYPYWMSNIYKIKPDGTGRQALSNFPANPDCSQTSANCLTLGYVWTEDNSKVIAAGRINGVKGLFAFNSNGSGAFSQIPISAGNAPDFVGGIVQRRVDRQVLSIGGGVATSGNYTLVSTIGEPIAGQTSVGGTYNLESGFWAITAQARKSPFDFDGDGKTDISIFRPAPGEWWYLKSSGGNAAFQFGSASDKIVPADFTGDGKTDIAFWRDSTGQWFILRLEDSSFFAFLFGTSGDVPVPADYDGDGKADAAVFRPSNQTWYISKSSGGTLIVQFGFAEDKPVVADYDGDGKADIAIFRPSVGQWWYLRSSDGANRAFAFGLSTDKPVPGDYTGDGKADIAFWRPSDGSWYILRSEDSSFFSFPFGVNGDIPAPGDYDGDGKTDATVFRPSSATWFANRSTAGLLIVGFGFSTDRPVPNAFVP